MAITQKAARAAEQLHEAAQEMARLAARRSAQAQGQPTGSSAPAGPALVKDPVEETCLPPVECGDSEIAPVRLTMATPAISEKAARIGVAGIAVPFIEACDAERVAGRP